MMNANVFNSSPRKKNFYAYRKVRGVSVFLHHMILPHREGYVVDHVNGQGLDNRRQNLRYATYSQNSCNQRLRSDNMSGVKGVSWDARDRNWTAEVTVDGKKHRLGRFKMLSAARAAYRKAARQLHGEFARPDGVLSRAWPAPSKRAQKTPITRQKGSIFTRQ